jgi:hypothetical protein
MAQNTLALVQKLIKTKLTNTTKNLRPGNWLFFRYNAKDKTLLYDATPCIFVLSVSPGYVLGLNWHWMPKAMKISMLRYILKSNKQNIKESKPLQFSYVQAKALIRKMVFRPVVRLYIKKRISARSLVIPNENIKEIALADYSTFVNGISSEEMYKKAKANAASRGVKKFKRVSNDLPRKNPSKKSKGGFKKHDAFKS